MLCVRINSAIQGGISTRSASIYNSRGNSQCGLNNGIIWNAVKVLLRANDIEISRTEAVLPKPTFSEVFAQASVFQTVLFADDTCLF